MPCEYLADLTSAHTIDLAGIDGLIGIAVDGNVVTVGGMTRHAELAARIGDAHVRNRGTIGGSVANSDPAADYPAAVVALDARVHTNKRAIAGDAFCTACSTPRCRTARSSPPLRLQGPKRAISCEVSGCAAHRV